MSANKFPDKLIGQKLFFKRYNIDPQDFRISRLDWNELKFVYADYNSWWIRLHPVAQFIANTLGLEEGVHAVSYRVKNPEHLVEKIIRRSKDDRSPWATIDNYRNHVKDLIGVRALHIFKEEWAAVDQSIRKHWDIKKKPVANVRDTDPSFITDEFALGGCTIERRSSGYRSVHYEIETKIAKRLVFIEVQVRTLFEEAWGEASHRIQYPHMPASDMIEAFLKSMSQTAGLGDNLGSAARLLRELDDPDRSVSPRAYKLRKLRYKEITKHISSQPSIQGEIMANLVS